jgi:hypothetical protein
MHRGIDALKLTEKAVFHINRAKNGFYTEGSPFLRIPLPRFDFLG